MIAQMVWQMLFVRMLWILTSMTTAAAICTVHTRKQASMVNILSILT